MTAMHIHHASIFQLMNDMAAPNTSVKDTSEQAKWDGSVGCSNNGTLQNYIHL